MKKQEILTIYTVYDSIDELNEADRELLEAAEKASSLAYAPYSGFHVGAAIKSDNGNIISGSNQENASFPVGICAERVALAHFSSQQPEAKINTIAIYANNAAHQQPAAPCGMCRQALFEQEIRQKSSIRILLKGNGNQIIEIDSVHNILPMGFSGNDLM